MACHGGAGRLRANDGKRNCPTHSHGQGPSQPRRRPPDQGRPIGAPQPDPDDRRSALLTLTKVGRTVYNEIVPLALEREADLLQILDATERAQLDALLAQLGSRADRII